MNPEKHRIAAAFSRQAQRYDAAAAIQEEVASRLAGRIAARLPAPARILEIGCGTGLLSQALAAAFPAARLTLTDISPEMLEQCRARLGAGPAYQVMDGEAAEGEGPFDLIASSLAFQWFADISGSIARLTKLLAPSGRLIFTTLGCDSFLEWRQAHAALGLSCGLHEYPSADALPLPAGVTACIGEERIAAAYPSGRAFLQALKTLGAGTPRPGYRPLSPGAFRQLLRRVDGRFTVTYHILTVEIARLQPAGEPPG